MKLERGIRYTRTAYDLARFRSDPADDAITAFVEQATRLAVDDLATVRSALTEDEAAALLTFARRQATLALREGALDRARQAVAALTLVDRDVVEPRAVRLGVGLPLYAVRELGGDVTATVDEAMARSEGGIAAALAARRAIVATMGLEDCGYVQVSTTHGLGLVAHRSTGAGHRTGPGPGPAATALAETAVAMSDLLDGQGDYRTGAPQVVDLAATWFLPRPKADDLAAATCVRISGFRPESPDDDRSGAATEGHSLLVFLADVERRRIATQLAEAAERASTPVRPRTAVTDGRLLLLVLGYSSTRYGREAEEAMETATSLARFGELLRPGLEELSGRARR